MAIANTLQELSSSPLVELFVLSNYNAAAPSEEYRFTPWPECDWLGQHWHHLDCTTSGFKSDGRSLARPTIRVANVGGEIAAIVRNYKDLIGATIWRYRTQEMYLQANSGEMLLAEEWRIQQKTSETREIIEWELAALDLENTECPRRIYQSSYCGSQYRDPSTCGYSGPPVADINDQPTSNPLLDACGRKIGSCRLRFGANSPLPIDIFPGLN
jgi:lambda family phage minor tail protein L